MFERDIFGLCNYLLENLRKIKDPIYFICRRGIASVSATNLLLENGFRDVWNIDGGLTEWKKKIDENFPFY